MTTYVRRSTAAKTQQATLRNTAHTTRVFGYCRVSTDMQAQQGLSLDDQREAIKLFALTEAGPSRKFLLTVASRRRTPIGPRFNG
jgi:hypothetical protein